MADAAGREASWPGVEVELADSRRALTEKLGGFFRRARRPGPVAVLELGCGDGHATDLVDEALRRWNDHAGTRLLALDADVARLGKARRFLDRRGFAHVRLLAGDFYRLPLPAASFDFVVALNVVFWSDRSRLFREAHRVLRPGGEMLVYDLLPRDEGQPRPRMTFVLTRDQLSPSPALASGS